MFYGNAGSQEDLFLQGLFDSGEANSLKALKAKLAACKAQGGTWDPDTEMCVAAQPPVLLSPYPYGFSYPFPTGFIGGGGGHHHHRRHGGHHGMDNFDVMYLEGLSDMGALGAVGPAQAKCIAGGGSWTGPAGKKTCVYTSSQVSGPSGTVVKRPVPQTAPRPTGMVRGHEKYQPPAPSVGQSPQAIRQAAQAAKQAAQQAQHLAAQKARQDAQAAKQAQHLAAQKARQDAQAAQQAKHQAAQKAKQEAHAAQKLAHQAAQEKAKADHAAKIAAQKSARDAQAATHAANVAAQKANRAANKAANKADRQSKQQAAQAAHEAAVAAHKAKQEQIKADRAAKKAERQALRHPGIVPDVAPMPYPAPGAGVLPPGVTPVMIDRYNACLTKQRRGQKIRCYAPPGYVAPPLPPPIYGGGPIYPTPVPPGTPPDWYTTPPAWWTAMPPAGDSGTFMPPDGAPVYPPPSYSGPLGPVSGGGGGGGGGAGPMLDDSGLVPPSDMDAAMAQGGAGAAGPGGMPGGPGAPGAAGSELAANDECNPAFNATLPQTYKDQWGDMVVLQVFCAQQPAAQMAPMQFQPQDNYGVQDFVPSQGGGSGVDPFAPYEDTAGPVEADVTGPMGTKSITSVEAGEIGGEAPMGTGFGW